MPCEHPSGQSPTDDSIRMHLDVRKYREVTPKKCRKNVEPHIRAPSARFDRTGSSIRRDMIRPIIAALPLKYPTRNFVRSGIRLSPRLSRCRSSASGSPPKPNSVAGAARISGLCHFETWILGARGPPTCQKADIPGHGGDERQSVELQLPLGGPILAFIGLFDRQFRGLA